MMPHEPRVLLDGLAYVESPAGTTVACGSPIGAARRS
jgi:hypothetical protein